MIRKKVIGLAIICLVSTSTLVIAAQKLQLSGNELLKRAESIMSDPDSSPVRRIDRDNNKNKKNNQREVIVRSIDGSNNNLSDPDMNAIETQLVRIADAEYADGISALAGANRPNPRSISNSVLAQNVSTQTANLASDFLWQWGQFLDHDINQ